MSRTVVSRVFVAGHRGLVGSAILRAIGNAGGAAPIVRTRAELDLRNQSAVSDFFARERPEVVYLAAAIVGGILANSTRPWEFLYDNLAIQNNVISSSLAHGVRRLVFLGSSCIYPKLAQQPISEDQLLTGPLEPTNEFYAIAKIAGLKLVEAANRSAGRAWVSLMPTNLYGPGDNFDLQSSHVLPALLRKFHEAKVQRDSGDDSRVTLWGDGSALREFLHVDDLAAAALRMGGSADVGLFNVGCGADISIKELAALIADVVGYDGPVYWDHTRPNGTPRKLLDSSRIRATGWAPRIPLREGVADLYGWYLASIGAASSATVSAEKAVP